MMAKVRATMRGRFLVRALTGTGLTGAAAMPLMLALVMVSMPAQAQDTNTDTRLRKVESEVRALQRKVFPGADGKYFEPEIKATPAPVTTPGQPASTPVSDLLTRMDAVEGQMARLTAQTEQNTNRIAQLEARLAAADTAAAPAPIPGAPVTGAPLGAPQSNLDAMTGGASARPVPAASVPVATVTNKPAATAPKPIATAPKPVSSARVEAVKAVVKPQSADPGEDEYSYGYRLWEARFYPEAEQQLKLYLEKYPKHARASYGRNLLGRAFLDDGNPSEAAKWFLQNFQTDKRGDRASDSLLYLAISMKQLKDTRRACIALAEFSETYAAEAAGRLSSLYTATRNGLTCS